jgi:hypothetical protein
VLISLAHNVLNEKELSHEETDPSADGGHNNDVPGTGELFAGRGQARLVSEVYGCL